MKPRPDDTTVLWQCRAMEPRVACPRRPAPTKPKSPARWEAKTSPSRRPSSLARARALKSGAGDFEKSWIVPPSVELP